ncbi:MAG: hypothetical protein HMLIMOIP_001254 [Candidatus Nitrosomirales archaeon]|jgi:hypothetical protein
MVLNEVGTFFLDLFLNHPEAVVAAIGIPVAAVVSLIANYYHKKQLHVTTLFKIFELLNSPETRDARDAMYKEYCHLVKQKIPIIFNSSEHIKRQAYIVKSAYDHAGVLYLNGFLNEELFFKIYGERVVRDWEALEEDIRKDWPHNPKICEHFKTMRDEFKKRFEKSYTEEKMRHLHPYCKE